MLHVAAFAFACLWLSFIDNLSNLWALPVGASCSTAQREYLGYKSAIWESLYETEKEEQFKAATLAEIAAIMIDREVYKVAVE